MPRRPATIAWVMILAAAVALSAGLVSAAAPPRSRYQDNVLVTRYAWFNPVGERFGGLWRLDPESATYTRLRPFVATFDSNRHVPALFLGGDGYLSAVGDTVTYQTWPGLYEFDAFSWRMIRRLPASTAADELGWAVQGPYVSAETASDLGLDPGAYGFGRCVLGLVAPSRESTLGRTCGPWPFPGEPLNPNRGTDGVVLSKGGPTGEWTLAGTLEANDWWMLRTSWAFPPSLGFDWQSQTWWRPSLQGLQLLDVEDHRLVDLRPPVDFSFSPFDRSDVEVDRVHLFPGGATAIGTAVSVGTDNVGDERFLFVAETDTGNGTLLQHWDRGVEGCPSAFAALGEDPDRHEQLIPIVAAGPGVRGTEWTTELWLYNPSRSAVSVDLRRVTAPEQTRSLDLPPHGSLAIPDALGWLGAGPAGDGTAHEAVVVTSDYHWGEQLVAVGRISTVDPATGGRFGHEVPAVPFPFGYSNHLPYLWGQEELEQVQSPGLDPAFLSFDLVDPQRFRANVGVVNDLDAPVTLRLLWGYNIFFGGAYPEHRPPEAVREISVEPHGVRVLSLDDLFPPEIRHHYPPRIAVAGELPAVIWLSVVDNLTGDATFVPFTGFQYYNDNTDDRLVIPAVARIAGRNGSVWRTDLVGPLREVFPLFKVLMAYRPSQPTTACGGAAAGEGSIENLVLGDIGIPWDIWLETLSELIGRPASLSTARLGNDVVFRDLVSLLPGCENEEASVGALEVATGNWTAGWSRTYTTRPDGGTYGGMLPFYPPGGWPVQHFAGLEVSSEQRINVGLYNGIADHPVTHRLLLYAADGTLAASREIILKPHEHRQESLARLLAVPVSSLPNGLYGLTVIPLDDPEAGVEGRSWAYVSLVDNRTNDPVNLW